MQKHIDYAGTNRIEDVDIHLLNNSVIVNCQVDEEKLDHLIKKIKEYVISMKQEEKI